jgi:hypothetical protein
VAEVARFGPEITVGAILPREEKRFDIESARPVATYTQQDYARIAAAVGKDVSDVMAHQKDFENAALIFRLDRGSPSELARPRGSTPTQMRRKLERVEKSARRFLEDLGVRRDDRGLVIVEEAYDGPGDSEILRVLSWAVERDEDLVITATRRLGRLAEILEAIEAAGDLEQWARRGADEVIEFGRLTVPKEHQGDVPFNNWIAAMLSVYKRTTGKDPGTSVGAPASSLQRKATGPVVRFLAAAEKPLGLEHCAESLRDRVRDILRNGRRRTR